MRRRSRQRSPRRSQRSTKSVATTKRNASVSNYRVCDARGLERPFNLSEQRQVTQYVPAEVQKQLGEDTYAPKVGERLFRDQHQSQMKPRIPDPRGKHVKFDYTDFDVGRDDRLPEEHEYSTPKIVEYCAASEVPGGYEFKT